MSPKPIELTDIQRQEVETLAALMNQEQIADDLGIVRNTFRAICDRDADVAERYERGKAKAIAHVAKGLLQKVRSGDTTSSIFYLKTQGGWRETDRLKHSGPDGTPLAISASDQLHHFLGWLHQRMRETGHLLIQAHAEAPELEARLLAEADPREED